MKELFNITPLDIWKSMLAGDDMYEFKKELPEECCDTIDDYVCIFRNDFNKFIADVIMVYDVVIDLSDKELGLWISDRFNNTPQDIKDCMFLMRKKDFLGDVMIGSSVSRTRVFDTFRPKSNII